MTKALFLDRDGVMDRIVKNAGGWDSPQKSQDVSLVKGIEKVILWANQQKIPVIEISNQPGVAKGKMDQKTADAIEAKVHQLLKEKGATIDKTYICPHHPEAVIPELKEVCDCRKPKPGLLLKAARELDIDLGKSIFIGDNATDVEAAKNAGVKSLIYLHNEDEPDRVRRAKLAKADFKASSMQEALKKLEDHFKLT